MGVLGNKNLEKFRSRELEFWPKHGWKCKKIVKIENRGQESGTLMVNWWAREWRLAWKKGVMTAAHPHTPFQCECPPGERYTWNKSNNKNLVKLWNLREKVFFFFFFFASFFLEGATKSVFFYFHFLLPCTWVWWCEKNMCTKKMAYPPDPFTSFTY